MKNKKQTKKDSNKDALKTKKQKIITPAAHPIPSHFIPGIFFFAVFRDALSEAALSGTREDSEKDLVIICGTVFMMVDARQELGFDEPQVRWTTFTRDTSRGIFFSERGFIVTICFLHTFCEYDAMIEPQRAI